MRSDLQRTGEFESFLSSSADVSSSLLDALAVSDTGFAVDEAAEPHRFYNAVTRALDIVLSLAALTTVVFQRLKQPVVFGYLLAGMIAGPHIPIPLVADEPTVRTLSELGVILLMFSLGLEFSLRKMVRIMPRAGVVALFQAGVEGMQQRGKAALGDKTMMDAWLPAVDAMKSALEAGGDVSAILDRGTAAAEAGAEATRSMSARKGRASYIGDRSVGHPDPGAIAASMMLKAAADTWRS